MTTTSTPLPAPPAEAVAVAAPPGRARWRWSAATTPAKLRLLMGGLALLALAWGGVGAWTASLHAMAARDVDTTSEPLSIDAQQMYQSLSDADVTVMTAFLSGPAEPLAARERFSADIAQAAVDLTDLRNAAAGGNRQLQTSLAALAAGLPVYAGDVAAAQAEYSMGYQLTAASFMQVASEEMHLTLLPAARSSYQQEDARLVAASATATGMPWVAVALALTIVTGAALLGTQRWLSRRTHRMLNYGLVTASATLVICGLWLIGSFVLARSDLQRGVGHGATPAEELAQASIDVQQARGDEVLNLISRSGDASFKQDFSLVRGQIGPGPGSLLTSAAASASGTPATGPVAAAEREATAWYAVNDQLYRLDVTASYPAETQLVIGTGPSSSAPGFGRLENSLSQAITADQVVFRSSANSGAEAFTGLEAGIIAASLVIAAGCVWGLDLRLAEYR